MGTVSLKRLQKNVSPFPSHCLFWNLRVKTRMRFFISLMAMCAVLRAAEQQNILWITAEDMSATLGCYGDKYARTPNIDRLAKVSVRYTKGFASAPVCSPSRSCLITGCHPSWAWLPIKRKIHGALCLSQAYFLTDRSHQSDTLHKSSPFPGRI
jgi:uncharacterized sulfatase